MLDNPFSIPWEDTWCIKESSCPHCEEKYGLHMELYTDGIIEACGYCGFVRKLKVPYPKSEFLKDNYGETK